MLKKNFFIFCIIFFSSNIFGQDTVINPFLAAFDKIVKGNVQYFDSISGSKDAHSNYAFYLCKAKLASEKEEHAAAFAFYKKAIEMAPTNKDKAIANLKTGIYFINKDLLIQALEYFNKAELLYSFAEEDKQYIEVNKYIGMVNSFLGNKQKAIERFLKVYSVGKKTNNGKLTGSAANQIAVMYKELGNYDEAEKFLNLSLNIRIKENDKFWMGQNYNNFGDIYFEKKEYDKAILFFNKGYLLRKNYGDDIGAITESEVNLGKTYFKLNKLAEAEMMLRASFEKGLEKGNLLIQKRAAFYLKDLYYKKNDFQKAFEMQAKFQMAQDSLFGLEKREEVNRMGLENEFKGKILSDSLAMIKQDTELKAKESKNKQNNILLSGLAVVLLLVLFIVFNLFRQNKKEQEKNILISKQSNELKEQHKEIKDSINYAQNLQSSLLPSNKLLENSLKDHFVLYLPKDVVSGDFYWSAFSKTSVDESHKGLFHLALADCTGHGVPGAIVSVVGINCLSRCVNEFKLNEPGKILDKLSELVAEAFSNNNKQLNDGMDISFCTIKIFNEPQNGITGELKFAGANNPLWVIRNKNLIEFKGTRRPVGAFINDLSFKEETIELQNNDLVYLVTDGFSDQFGGHEGKKFKQSRLKELMLEIHTLPHAQQKEKLHQTFLSWKTNHEQVDDISVIGFRIS